MSKATKIFVLLTLVCALVTGGLLGRGYLEKKKTADAKEQELAVCEESWRGIADEKDVLEDELYEVEDQLFDAQMTLDESTSRAEELKAQIETLKKEIEALKAELEK